MNSDGVPLLRMISPCKALVRAEITGIAETVISSYTLMMIEVSDLSGVAFDVMKYFGLLLANIV